MKQFKLSISISVVVCIFSFQFLAQNVAYAVNRISYTPANPNALSAGQSNTFTFSLDEPIICPDAGLPCEVSLTFTNSSPSTVSLSTSTLVWTSAQWAQNRTLTLTADADLVYSDSSSVTITSAASSNAEYYRNYRVTITQSVTLPPSPEEIAAAERAAAAEAARGDVGGRGQEEVRGNGRFDHADLARSARGGRGLGSRMRRADQAIPGRRPGPAELGARPGQPGQEAEGLTAGPAST